LPTLHCVSVYLVSVENYNLHTIPDIIKRLDFFAGLSDHTVDNATAITSIAPGANLVGKYFTLDHKGGGQMTVSRLNQRN